MDIKVAVPPSQGAAPSLSLYQAPGREQHQVIVELGNSQTVTFEGRLDDLFNLFAGGYDMLGAFLFGSVSRLSASETPAVSKTEVG